MSNHRNLIIIGSGPAGLTAGIYAARASLAPLLIKGNKPGGQLMGTSIVENWPGSISISGSQLMMTMDQQALNLGCEMFDDFVESVNFSTKPFKILTSSKQSFTADAVIIATGNAPRKLDCPGETEYWGKGISTCAVCDAAFYRNRAAIVVGGGDTAMEMASFLSKFTTQITIVHAQEHLTASRVMQERVLENKNITIFYNSIITEIKGDGKTVTSATLRSKNTDKTTELATHGVFLAIGQKPQTDFLKDKIELLPSGHIKAYNHTKTSIEGIFCAGDVADNSYRQAIAASGSGCMAALDAQRYLESLKKK